MSESENYNFKLEEELKKEERYKEEIEGDDYYEEIEEKLGRRAKKLHKTKYGPKGATTAAQFRRMQECKFYRRGKIKPKIKIIDKTKK